MSAARGLAAVAAVAAVLAVAGCSSGSGDKDQARKSSTPATSTVAGSSGSATPRPRPSSTAPSSAPPTSSATGSGSTSPTPAAPTGPTARSGPPDPLAPPTPPPVTRDGQRPDPTVSAAPQSFQGSVSYADGISLRVTRISQSTQTEQGPGYVSGDPITTFALTLRNGGHAALRLNQVVASASYGRPARSAKAVYGKDSQDFSGTVAPGHSAQAVYAFSVPTDALANVTFFVDFDGRHTAATFRGAAK